MATHAPTLARVIYLLERLVARVEDVPIEWVQDDPRPRTTSRRSHPDIPG